MGCGCSNKNKGVVSSAKKTNARVSKPTKAAVKTVAGKATKTFASSKKRIVENAQCQGAYDTLALLERKAVALHNKFRFSQNGYRFAETQKIIRKMIVNLSNECPDEDELGSVKEYINNEYAKYFNVNN